MPLVLLILPPDYFDKGQTTCLSVILIHKTCPGCGITRAIQHLIHLDFEKAWAFNKLAFIVFPALSYFYAVEFLKLLRLAKSTEKR